MPEIKVVHLLEIAKSAGSCNVRELDLIIKGQKNKENQNQKRKNLISILNFA